MSLNSVVVITKDDLTGFWRMLDVSTNRTTYHDTRIKCFAALTDLAGYAECRGREVIIREFCLYFRNSDKFIILPTFFDTIISKHIAEILRNV